MVSTFLLHVLNETIKLGNVDQNVRITKQCDCIDSIDIIKRWNIIDDKRNHHYNAVTENLYESW